MRSRVTMLLAGALFCLAPTMGWADLAPYDQDFEGLNQADPGALAGNGWLIFGNVFNPDWSYAYGYGPYPAPNGGPAFSAIDVGQGGPGQGTQQLSVYSDYNNSGHGHGLYIEANVFQEQTIGAADVGATWVLEFEAKRGNIEGNTTARAFFKTLDPNAGYALTNFIWTDMTNVPATWESHTLSIFIDPNLEGQILQFGFLNTATGYQGSGVFYDNLSFSREPLAVHLDVKPGSCPNPMLNRARGVLPVAVLGTAGFDVYDIDVDSLRLEGVAPINSGSEDVAGPYGGELCGCTTDGPDGYLDLTLKFLTQELIGVIANSAGDETLTLTGMLLDGTPIEGRDCIVIVGGGGGRPSSGRIEPPDDSNSLGTRPGSGTTFGRN